MELHQLAGMTPFELHRVAVRPEGAFGVLLHDGLPFAVTLERTYDELDERGRPSSKIPVGVHRCTRSFFHRGGYSTFEVHIPGHSRLLFHRGNTEKDSEGCILVAESFGELGAEPAILESVMGFAEFMRRASSVGTEFQLVVTEKT